MQEPGEKPLIQRHLDISRLPYEFLNQLCRHLSSEDLLALCQTSRTVCRLLSGRQFWRGKQPPDVNAALQRKLCLPIESLSGTYLPSLEDPGSYSDRVVYLHDLGCGGNICMHDSIRNVPGGSFAVQLSAKLSPHWQLRGDITEVAVIPERGDSLRAKITAGRWRQLVFSHGYDAWFPLRLGRIRLDSCCDVHVRILNSGGAGGGSGGSWSGGGGFQVMRRRRQLLLNEGLYLDLLELVPISCGMADTIGYPRRLAQSQRRTGWRLDEGCRLL